MKRSEFWAHVAELRTTLLSLVFLVVTTFVATFFFHQNILDLLLAPLDHTSYIQLSPIEGFLVALKLSLCTALLISAPFALLILWKFISPALYSREKRAFFLLLPLTILFLSMGIGFAYKFTLPVVMRFLSGFTIGEPLWALAPTINFVLSLLLAHALCFELFALLFVLVHFGLVRAEHLASGRRYVVVGLFILAAIFTPPDVISQLLLVCPLWILYETINLYAKIRVSAKLHEHDG